MKTTLTSLAALLAMLTIGTQMAVAEDQDSERVHQSIASPDRDRLQDADAIYGESLMTDEEKLKYRDELAALESEQERERYRYRHRLRMQERAREQGVELPDMQEATGDIPQVPESGAAPMPGSAASPPGSHGGGISGGNGGGSGGGSGGGGSKGR